MHGLRSIVVPNLGDRKARSGVDGGIGNVPLSSTPPSMVNAWFGASINTLKGRVFEDMAQSNPRNAILFQGVDPKISTLSTFF